MFQLIYISEPRFALSQDVLREIAQESRDRNMARGITGVLLMAGRTVMQVLEGAETDVRTLYETITSDVRHKNCKIIVSRHAPHREFGDWNLGFCEVGSDEADTMLQAIMALKVSSMVEAEPERLAS